MKKKDLKALKDDKVENLKKLLSSKKTEKAKIALNITIGKEKNIRKVKSINKEIAQILTFLKEKLKSETLTNKNK